MFIYTQEIGSIARPNWLIKKLRGIKLEEDEKEELNYWIKFSSFEEKESLLELVAKEKLESEDKKRLKDFSSLLVIQCFEKIGLDIIYDGEQHRSEMYQEPISCIEGFKFYGDVRSFDNKYYKKAACIGEPGLKSTYHIKEFEYVENKTQKPLKVPITGAYTLTKWSFNEYYLRRWKAKSRNMKIALRQANRELALSLARNVIRPNIESLIKAGAKCIQIDEPAATTDPDEIDIFVESFNESTEGTNCKFNIHICFSDYSLLYPEILNLKNCSQYTFEFAQGEKYDFLELMRRYSDNKEIGLGVIDVHTDRIESPELIKDRILKAIKILEPERIYINPDCGLRTRSWKVAFEKLQNMVKGVMLARVKTTQIAGIFALLLGNAYAQVWNVQVVDSFSYQNFDYGRGYYGIDLTRVGEELHFSSKLMKDDTLGNYYGYIVYGTKRLSGWEINTVIDGRDYYQKPTSITFDGEENSVIFSQDGYSDPHMNLCTAYWNGSDWNISTADDSLYTQDAIYAFCDNSGKPGCIYYNYVDEGEYPNIITYYGYSEVKWTGTEWQRGFVVLYNDSITQDYSCYTYPSVSATANAVYMSQGVIIPNGDEPGDTVAIMIYRDGGAGWSLDGKYTDMTYSDYPYLVVFHPCIGTAPDGHAHIWAYSGSDDIDDPYLIRTETGWEYTGAVNITPGGWSVERQELHFSQDSTAFWLTINTNWNSLWVNWRTPGSTYGYSEIPMPGAGTPHTPDLIITSEDTLHILFGFDYEGGQSVGLCEATAYIPDLLTGVEEQTSLTPDAFYLGQNYPNPFSTKTVISYELRVTSNGSNDKLVTNNSSLVTISIFDLSGRLVRSLPITDYQSPITEVVWDGKDKYEMPVPSGIYFYQLKETSGIKRVRKMLLLR